VDVVDEVDRAMNASLTAVAVLPLVIGVS
jgi:hypothetical protein